MEATGRLGEVDFTSNGVSATEPDFSSASRFSHDALADCSVLEMMVDDAF